MTRNNHTLLTLGYDLLFILGSVFLILKGRFLGVILGMVLLVWSGRDFWNRIKALLGTRKPQNDTVIRTEGPKRKEDNRSPENGKILVTDLFDAKEVDFEKE